MDSKILIIIPAYNEEESILKTCNEIIKYNKNNKSHYDFIVINDCSKDKTLQICKENNLPTISLIHNLGIGGAVQTGYKYAYAHGYDIAIQYDGDGQHDVAYVKNIIQPILEKKADFVVGSRFVTKGASEFQSSAARRVGIKMISTIIKILTNKRIYDVTSGFRAANKKIIKMFANDYPVEYPEPITNMELLKAGYSVSEVPVAMRERDGGVSSIRSWKNAYYMINVILSLLVFGLRGEK